ncbi:MAG: putative transcriptional regulator [Caulobacteraceae bacterium]|nr:putative transcriptional regulator [Caulobacteraceae bacterium]
MPRDLGAGADSTMVAQGGHRGVRQDLDSLLNAGANIGQALRALREAQGLSLEAIAQTTCIRRAYLQALEEMNIEALPSRPFAIGYVRAFAQTLGVNSEIAVAKFREDAPSPEEALKAPVGVRKERDPRLSWLAGAGAVVVTAVVIWNLAQHAVARDGGPTPPVPVTNAPPPAPLAAKGPVALASAQPAPADSDVPTPYVTPGMTKGPDGKSVPTAPAVKAALNPRAAVYGAPANQAVVTLQAIKGASLVIRGADGSIYFARQLSAGESYRAPAGVQGLTIDVSDPQAFNVLMNGQAQGPLLAAQTPIGKLTAKTAPTPQA